MLVLACAAAAAAALRLSRHLPPAANQIDGPAPAGAVPADGQLPSADQPAGPGGARDQVVLGEFGEVALRSVT